MLLIEKIPQCFFALGYFYFKSEVVLLPCKNSTFKKAVVMLATRQGGKDNNCMNTRKVSQKVTRTQLPTTPCWRNLIGIA
jgi:hypothetical protein